MILIDANLLLYAYNETAEHHDAARAWLEKVLSGTDQVWLAWVTILAFLRISTDSRAVRNPFKMREACEIVGDWLARPQVSVLNAGERHWDIFQRLLLDAHVRPQHTTDAHLAALAIEHGATVYSLDRDFARFPGLKFMHPL
ncbi:MAG TPA: type II toxin-antitoxin system VapC family toxin [Terriglobales bacterium]|nr:type II toxin-antitoxin system VapC family toxin [Terriglobales bacterium]